MNSKKVNWFYLCTVLIYIGTIIGVNVYYYIFGTGGVTIITSLLLGQAIIFVPAALFVLFSREKINAVLGFRKIKISSILMIILFTYLMLPITTVINAVSMLFVDNTVTQMSGAVLQMPMALMVLLMGVLGPLSEEMIFRGMVFGGYKKSGNTVKAIILSALLFGLMHMNFNQAAYAIFLGVVMAVLVEATGSLWGSVVFHMTVNIENVMLMYISRSMFTEEYTKQAEQLTGDTQQMLMVIGIYGVIAMVTTSIALCVLAWVAKNEQREEHLRQIWASRKEKSGRTVTIPLVTGIVIAVAFMAFELIVSG